MNENEQQEESRNFKALLYEAGFESIDDLCDEMDDKYDRTVISRRRLFAIQKENRDGEADPRLSTIEKLAEILSLRGIQISPDTVAKALGHDWGTLSKRRQAQTVKHHLVELEKYLTAKLEEIHYADRRLQPISDSNNETLTEEQLIEEPQALVTAESGMGKSTLFYKFAQLATQVGKIPVYVDLNADHTENFQGYIWSQAISKNAGLYLELTEEELHNQSYVFFFDHLDMATPKNNETYPSEVRFINAFVTNRSGHKDTFIVCCRSNFDHYFEKLHGDFKKFTLQELTGETDVPQLLWRRYGLRRLHSNSEKNRRLLDFAKSPQRMKMIAKIYEEIKKEGKEPEVEREVEIYDQYVDIHLKEEEAKWKSTKARSTKKAALAWLAYKVMTSTDPEIQEFGYAWTKDVLRRKILPKLIKNADGEYIKEAINEILAVELIVLSPDKMRFAFSHSSLRDFFCAWHLAKNKPTEAIDIILSKVGDEYNILDPKWEKIIPVYAGLNKDASLLIKALLDESTLQEDILLTNLKLASKCITEIGEVGDLRKSVIEKAIGLYKSYGGAHFYRTAHEIITTAFHPDIMDCIVKHLEGSDPQSRQYIAELLGLISSPLATPLLLHRLKDKSPDVILAAVVALGKIGSEDAIKPLISCLNHDCTSIREAAAISLISIRSDQRIVALLDVIDSVEMQAQAISILKEICSSKLILKLTKQTGSKNKRLKRNAVFALAELREENAIPLLINMLNTETRSQKKLVASALAELGTKDALLPLIQVLRTKSHPLRFHVFRVLCKVPSRMVLGELITTLNKDDQKIKLFDYLTRQSLVDDPIKMLEDKNDKVRIEAIRTLRRQRLTEALPQLIKMLWDSNAEVRQEAVYTLGYFSPDIKFPLQPLINMLKDDNEEVRLRTIHALGCVGSSIAVKAIATAINDISVEIKTAITYELSRLNLPETVPILIDLLKDDNVGVRFNACKYLRQKKLGDIKSIYTFTNLLKDEHDEVKVEAIYALGILGSPEVIEHLAEALKNNPDYIRIQIILALGQIGSPCAIKHLECLLSDNDHNIRMWTIRALGMIDSPEIIEHLVKLLNDKNYRVRLWAIDSLGQEGSEKSAEALLTMLDDANSKVRQWAISALGKTQTEQAYKVLRQALQNKSISIKLRAAFGLGNQYHKSAVKLVLELLNHINSEIRQNAFNTMKELITIETFRTFTKHLQTTDQRVRNLAITFSQIHISVSPFNTSPVFQVLPALSLQTGLKVTMRELGYPNIVERIKGQYDSPSIDLEGRIIQRTLDIEGNVIQKKTDL